jgi:hypothetical protein
MPHHTIVVNLAVTCQGAGVAMGTVIVEESSSMCQDLTNSDTSAPALRQVVAKMFDISYHQSGLTNELWVAAICVRLGVAPYNTVTGRKWRRGDIDPPAPAVLAAAEVVDLGLDDLVLLAREALSIQIPQPVKLSTLLASIQDLGGLVEELAGRVTDLEAGRAESANGHFRLVEEN